VRQVAYLFIITLYYLLYIAELLLDWQTLTLIVIFLQIEDHVADHFQLLLIVLLLYFVGMLLDE
jgi:hypothetical protein